MKEYTVTDVQALLSQGDVVVIDVREHAELTAQRVPGMTHLPMSEIDERIDEIPTDREVVLFCRSGNRSGILADRLTALGDWGEVANCVGGILAWAAAGLPYEGEQPT